MRNISAGLKAAVAREDLSLSYLFKITLRSGATFYYTDNGQSIYFADVLWRADPGIDVSAIRDAANSLSQTATLDVGYADDMITEQMVRSGALNGATHQILLIDYRQQQLGAFELFSGYIDKLTASNRYTFSVDLTGWQGKSYTLNGVFSLKCRNVFCDAGCTLNLSDYSYDFTVSADSLDGVSVAYGEAFAEGLGDFGSVLWKTGRNAGEVTPIATNDAGIIYLTAAPSYLPKAGDTGVLRQGCDYYKATCKTKYNNLRNFQAEPAVPQGTTTSSDPTTTTATTDTSKPPVDTSTPVYTGGYPPAA